MRTYREIIDKSIIVEESLLEFGLIERPIKGRFRVYQKIVRYLRDEWELEELDNNIQVSFLKQQQFALKELCEIIDIFEKILQIYSFLNDESKIHIKQRIKIILEGPDFSEFEKPHNSGNRARNFQFELRLTSAFIKAGYIGIKLQEQCPDLMISMDERNYAFECKRVLKPKTRLFKNINEAISQLQVYEQNYFCSVVCLDLSPGFEQENSLINAPTVRQVNEFAANYIKHYWDLILSTYKLRDSRGKIEISGLLINLSFGYHVNNNNEMGWNNFFGVLTFGDEKSEKVRQFQLDMENFKRSIDEQWYLRVI